MKLRLNDRIAAREMREKGLSFREIFAKIPDLSKGTLSGWLKDIELTTAQKERLLAKSKDAADKGRVKGSFTNREKRIRLTQQIISDAKAEAMMRTNEALFTTGVMLYWAEGRKTREEVGFTNADPVMIQLMMYWFRNVCKVQEKKLRIALSIISLHDKKTTESYWSGITQVPLSQFYKTTVKATPLKGKRNPSYMGTCYIRVCDRNLFRKIMGWKLGLIQSFGKYAPIAQLDRANGF